MVRDHGPECSARAKETPMSESDSTPANFSLSVIAPMLNEEDACASFFSVVVPILEKVTRHYEIVCIDDGSSDQTAAVVLAHRAVNPHIKLLMFSRNFGKEAALSAGLDYASGDAVIPMDVDLQDPPELIPALVAEWRKGADEVIAVRSARDSDTWLKRVTAQLFYRIIDRISDVAIPQNAGDYRLLDRKVIDILQRLPERNRFMKGLYAWAGFRQAIVTYERPARAHGMTKFRYWKLWNFALDGLFSFSTLPLRIWTYIGVSFATLATLYGLYIVVRTLLLGVDVPGYASLLVAVLLIGGMNMIGLGILGEYVGRVFLEVKHRPLYVVSVAEGFEDHARTARSVDFKSEYPAPIATAANSLAPKRANR
jgi:polyisoprenyl-phosphate glycosyltransferase